LTVRELLAEWMCEAARRYRKHGRTTSELYCQRSAIRPLRELFADALADQIGPQQLTEVRERMVGYGWSRRSINLHVSRIRAVWKWGASLGLVPAAAWQSLQSVAGLRRGRSAARESTGRRPVTWRQLRAVLRACSPKCGRLVRLQWLTGMRPGEACALDPSQLDRSGPLWRYVVPVAVAKTGKEVYWLGPRAQRLLADLSSGPLWPHQRSAYTRHVARACRRAGCEPFSPHCLRHSHGTIVRDRYGAEAASARLNHSRLSTTEIYTATASGLARRVAAEIG
jgi:integrase